METNSSMTKIILKWPGKTGKSSGKTTKIRAGANPKNH
jgi:hypothetical protein